MQLSWSVIVLIALLVLPVALNLVLRWVIAPLVVRSKQRMAIRPAIEPTRDDQLTPELRQFVGDMVRQFAAEGFEAAANFHHPESVTDVRAVQIVFINRTSGDVGLVIASLNGTHRSLSFAVVSEFDDQTRLSTWASHTPSIFPPDPTSDGINARWVGDARTLYELHRRRLRAREWEGRPRVTPPPGGEADYVRRDWERELARYVRHGYKTLIDPPGTHLRLTYKGAFLTAWRLTEPLKSWRLRARDRRARREWDALGMDDWRPPEPAEAATAPPPLPAAPGLGYETSLNAGEIRQERIDGALVVRVGGLTPGGYLARHWYALLWPAAMILILSLTLLVYWRSYQFAARWAPGARSMLPRSLWLSLVMWGGLLAWDLYGWARKLRRARGTMVLSASEAGLTFRNAPAAVPDGHLDRAEVEALNVVPGEAGFVRRTYRLVAHVRGTSRKQTLATGPDQPALEQVCQALGEAMGIQLPDDAEELDPVPP